MKISDLKRRLCILGLLLVAASAIYLYYGSKSMPWEYQTWDGNSIYEIAYRAKRSAQSQLGLLLLAAGSFLQLIGLIKNEDILWLVKLPKKLKAKRVN